MGATNATLLGHSISPVGLGPNAEKASASVYMPMPKDLKQVRTLMGSINYYHHNLPDLSTTLRLINSLLRKGVNFLFAPALEKLVRQIIA